MRLASFSTGTIVDFRERAYRLAVRLSDGSWQAVDCETGQLVEWSAAELGAAYEAGRLTLRAVQSNGKHREPPSMVIPDLKEKQQATVRFRAAFLHEVERRIWGLSLSRKRLEAILAEVSLGQGRTRPVSVPTYYRWRGRAQEGVIALTDGRGTCKSRRSSGAEIAKQVMLEAILASRQTRKAGAAAFVTQAKLKSDIACRVAEENKIARIGGAADPLIKAPSKATLQRIWNEFPAEDRVIAEQGRITARHLFRGGPGVQRPDACLDLVEYDETRLPFFFYDELLGVPLGRAWLSWYIDTYSYAPIGFYVGFEPPSDLTITSALRHACLPKAYIAQEYPRIKGRYEPAGVPRRVTFDNGLCQWGKTIETVGLDLNMTIQFARPRTPWFKPRVEGSFKLLNTKLLQEMPGFVLGKGIDRKDYDPVKQGCIGIRHFLYIFHVWLVDIYLQQPQGMFGRTPASLWEEGTRHSPPDFLPRRHDLDLLFGILRDGRLDHRGVVFENLRYHSPELHALRRRSGGKLDVQVKVDPSDLGALHVRLDRSSGWIRAEAVDQIYAQGLSLHRHKLNLRNAREKFDDTSAEGLRRAQAFMHELIAEALPAAMSIRTNSLIARTLGIGTQHIFNKLDHDGALSGLGGPFSGHSLNPFEETKAKRGRPSPEVKSEPKVAVSRKRVIPNFDADTSLGGPK